MFSTPHNQMASAQSRSVAPETFLLDQDAQQSLPPDSIVALQQVDNLKYFLISAPVDWSTDQYIRRFLLPTGEYVSCVLWNNLFHISGTDIVRCLTFRFQAFGRPVRNPKKFEEGIFSDLRNLKSGTDASLEEPKSGFLDFLYKNNCIRTQKKQKVFYWYSVPHDRLFLDALERDLKREKMNQEATTVAISEPALSFEFDSSQSLFEQLTKAQQTNSSSFNGTNQSSAFHQSPAPDMGRLDSMPPPQMIPPPMPQPMPQAMPQTIPDDSLHHAAFQMSMPSAMNHMVAKTREQDFRGMQQFDRNGIPLNQIHQRHSSVPAYLEYSPAPSFVSSHMEEYSTRGMSFEPVTPPQHSLGMGLEPAYIANEETGLYSALPDMNMNATFNPLMQIPPSQLAAPPPFNNGLSRPFPQSNVYSVIEGSPTYKQRRRRSSLTAAGIAAITAGGSGNVHRPSDLRRSVSASVVPLAEVDETDHSPDSATNSFPVPPQPDFSRHGTPLATVEDSPVQQPIGLMAGEDYSNLSTGDDSFGPTLTHPSLHRTANGAVFRRARSATMMELGPYPQKSHSCPIPTCGRLFKRLEHLKRHVRTHTQERPYICNLCNKAFSRSDNLAQHRRTHEQNPHGEPLLLSGEEEEDEGVDFPAEDDAALGLLEEEDQDASPNSSENAFLTVPGGNSIMGQHSQQHQQQQRQSYTPNLVSGSSLGYVDTSAGVSLAAMATGGAGPSGLGMRLGGAGGHLIATPHY